MLPEQMQHEYELLVREVHAPVYFEKLAEYGIVPQSPEEEVALLELAGILQNEQAQTKLASASPLVAVVNELKEDFARRYNVPTVTSNDRLIKAAASRLASDERIRAAACRWGELQTAPAA